MSLRGDSYCLGVVLLLFFSRFSMFCYESLASHASGSDEKGKILDIWFLIASACESIFSFFDITTK